MVADQRARGGAGAAAHVDHAAGDVAARGCVVDAQRTADHAVHLDQHAFAAQRVQARAPEAEVHVVAGAPGAVVGCYLGEVVLGVFGGESVLGVAARASLVRQAEVGLEYGRHGGSLGWSFLLQMRQLPSLQDGATRPASLAASQRGMR